GLDRLLRVRSGALLEVAEDEARIRRARVGEGRFRPHLFAIDDDRMLVPEFRADLDDRGFVAQMELFRLPELDGVLPRPFVSKFHECNPSGARKAGARIRFRPFRSPDRFRRLVLTSGSSGILRGTSEIGLTRCTCPAILRTCRIA